MTAVLERRPTRTRFRKRERALILGVPALWAFVLLFHPTGAAENFYPIIRDNHARWMFVHSAMVVLIPLFAFALYRLIRGIDNTAARVGRIALPVFAVFYGVYEALMGLGTGMFVSSVETLPAAEQALAVEAYKSNTALQTLEYLASLPCGAALIATAFALHRASLVGWRSVVAILVATPLITVHVPPFGPIGLVLVIAAIVPVLQRPSAS